MRPLLCTYMTTQARSDNNLNKKDNQGLSHTGQGNSYADKRRQEKQEALREFLQGQKYIELIHQTLDATITNDELPVIKFKTETRLKLLNKVLPDLKAVEMSSDENNPLAIRLIERVIVDPYK